MKTIDRRHFLATAVVGTASTLFISGCASDRERVTASEPTPSPKPAPPAPALAPPRPVTASEPKPGLTAEQRNEWKQAASYAELPSWQDKDLFRFVEALPEDARVRLLSAAGVSSSSYASKSAEQQAELLVKELKWNSSSAISYIFKSNRDVDYTDLVSWSAAKIDVKPGKLAVAEVEREIFNKQFTITWDKMSVDQRIAATKEVNHKQRLSLSTAAMSTMSGAAALATLMGTVGFAGFGFYTTMSAMICAIAGIVGVTVPMAVYIAASTTIGVITGPVGWATLGLLALASAGLLGMASPAGTTRVIMALHGSRMEAIHLYRG